MSSEVLALLAAIVGLSAYLGTLRMGWLKELKATPQDKTAERNRLKDEILSVSIADFPLVVSGVLLTFHLFLPLWLGIEPPAALLRWATILFAGSVCLLALYHLTEMWKSVGASRQ